MKRRFLLILVALVLALLCGCTQENTGRYDVEFRGERYTVDLDAGSITHKGEMYLFAKEGTGDSVSYTIVYPNSARYFYNKSGMTANMSWSDGYDDERYVDGETLVDLLQEQGGFRECTDVQMEGYVWDYSEYPACTGEIPEEMTETQSSTAE